MAVNYRKVSQNKKGQFGPSTNNKFYVPKEDHNPTKKRGLNQAKTHWIYTADGQFCVFDDADMSEREVEIGLLGLDIADKKLRRLGQGGERVAFFPRPQNENDSWHGYPCSMDDIGDDFDDIISLLQKDGVINKSTFNKLIKKSI